METPPHSLPEMDNLDPDEEAFWLLYHQLNPLDSYKVILKRAGRSSSDSDSETDTTFYDTSQSKITFLDLPVVAKKRILAYAGLLRPCLIDVTYERVRVDNLRDKTAPATNCTRSLMRETRGSWTTLVDRACDHPRLPVELFHVSHAVRDEIAPIFFGINRFSVMLYSKLHFKRFCNGIMWGIERLKYLHIDLGPRDNRFLKLAPGIHRMVFNIWEEFCQLATERMLSLTYFSLKCRIRDLEVAHKLVSPMDIFPIVCQSAVHFNQLRDDDLRIVARRTCRWLVGDRTKEITFPYLYLPKEVQLLILEQLLIKRPDPYIAATDCSKGIVTLQDRGRQRTTLFPLTCCGTCSPLQAMCFCHARQTAYSTTCSCFSSPTPYFLVSRSFYEDARQIFFSKNNFAFMEEDPEHMMRLLLHIPTSSFMQIRHLTFKFPLAFRNTGRFTHRNEDYTLLSWAVLRRFIREHFDVSRLSLTIVDCGTKNHIPQSVPYRNRYLRKLLRSFADLRGLRDFRVYLADDRIFEKDAERAVMGPACIDRPKPSHMPFIGSKHLNA
ncbi:hypothetical protein BDV25DRAFT_105653 [Aspergillus avenaceus]|uniref:F-box domain-containing protein n=1 Tax=Aspergillus avenaceus TaxID=36643 RepID=A0A5N6TXI4_ASPAV|nr:hypothetical protein BDV25DRAFT_105653 [Aspergillus avenaceus]